MARMKLFTSVERVKDPTDMFEYDQNILGLFRGKEPDTIYVRAWQSEKGTQSTVYHETFHLWQFKQSLGFGEHSEKLAQDYAADIMKRMKLYGHDEEVYLDHLVGKDWSQKPEAEITTKEPPKAADTKRDGDFYYKNTCGKTCR